jgi:NADH dehydrogenase
MGTSIFVTGGAGYLGRRFLSLLSRDRFDDVRLLVLDPTEVEGEGATLVAGDLRRPADWEDRLAGVDFVIHLAAVTGKARPRLYREVIEEGTAALVGAAAQAGVRGFLHVSSIAVKFTDRPCYFYAASKLESEAIVAGAGVPFTILRPTMIAGPGAPVIEGLAKLAGGLVMPVFGRGEVEVQPIHVDDLARSMVDLLSEERFEGETIETGGPERLSIETLMERIRSVRFGKKPRALHLPLRFFRRVLCMMEPLLLPLLPLTAGQLATFANDGTAEPSQFMDPRLAGMAGVDEMVRGADDDE